MAAYPDAIVKKARGYHEVLLQIAPLSRFKSSLSGMATPCRTASIDLGAYPGATDSLLLP